MKLADINWAEIDWDFNSAGAWPKPVKIGMIALICSILAGLGFYYDTMGQIEVLQATQKKETELKTVFELKRNQAANLPQYQAQLVQIEQKLSEIINQMPVAEEIAGLLIDISQTGITSGLEFKLFKPSPAKRQDFYTEVPINIEVTGEYEKLCLFVSGLASLPRIVTLHDFTIAPIEKSKITKPGNNMLMSVVVKTYHENGKVENDTKTVKNDTKAAVNNNAKK